MFESEEAASSRLRFITQLAGGAAGMSLLAACGGATPSSSGSGLLAPGSPMLAAGARANNAFRLADTPQLQALLTKTGHYAVQQGTVAVIRHDMKRNNALVSKIARQVAEAKAKMQTRSGLRPLNRLGGGDGDGGGDYDGVPEFTFVVNVSTTYLRDDYLENDDYLGQYGAYLDPWDGFGADYGPIFTLPAWLQNCGQEQKQEIVNAVPTIAAYIISHSSEFGDKLVDAATLFTESLLSDMGLLLKVLGYGTASEILGLWELVDLTGGMIGNYISCAKRYGWN
jgi:hypothetical protein